MIKGFSKAIAPAVIGEITLARAARQRQEFDREFYHLENAHVLGQASTYWHVRVHWMMLGWAARQQRTGEIIGQLMRILGAALLTAFGWVPVGNTGGTNVSPFRVMAISPEHQAIIERAKSIRQ